MPILWLSSCKLPMPCLWANLPKMQTKEPLSVKVLIKHPTHEHCRRSNWRSLSYKSSWERLGWQAKDSKSGDILTRHRCRMQPPFTEGLPTSYRGRGFETSQSLFTQVYKNLYKWTVQDNGVDRTPHMVPWYKRCVAFQHYRRWPCTTVIIQHLYWSGACHN